MLVLIITVISLCCGCVDYVELSERAIVKAIGIDYLPDKKVYRISMQYFNQGGEGSQNQIDKTQDNVIKCVGEGENIFDAAKNASLLAAKDLLMSENKIIIIGSELQKYDLELTLEFFIGNYHSHPQAFVVAAENTAEELLDIRFKEGTTSSQRLSNLIKNTASEGKGKYRYPYEIMATLQSSTESAFLPLLKITRQKTDATVQKEQSGGGQTNPAGAAQQDEQGEKTITVDGAVIFSDRTAKGRVSADDATAVQLLNAEINEFSFAVNIEEYAKPSVTLTQITHSVKADVKDGKAVFDIKINAYGNLSSRGVIGENDTEAVIRVASLSEEKIESIIKNSVTKIKNEYGCDVFGFENILRQSCTEFYFNNRDDMAKIIRSADFNVDAAVDLFSLGLQSY